MKGLGGTRPEPLPPQRIPLISEPPALVFALQALAGDQPTAQPPLRPQQLAPPYTYAQGAQQTWVWPGPPPPARLTLEDMGGGLANWGAHSGMCEEGAQIFLLGTLPGLLQPLTWALCLHCRPRRDPWWVSTGWM